MRRFPHHLLPLTRRRIAGPNGHSNFTRVQSRSKRRLADLRQWHLQIAVNIVAERLQRRNVNNLRLVGQRLINSLTKKAIDRRQKCGERLTGTGWRRYERMLAARNGWP